MAGEGSKAEGVVAIGASCVGLVFGDGGGGGDDGARAIEIVPGGDACVGGRCVGVEGDGFEIGGLGNGEVELDEPVGVGGLVWVLVDGQFGEEEDIWADALDDGCDVLEAGVVWGVEVGGSDILDVEGGDAQGDGVGLGSCP